MKQQAEQSNQTDADKITINLVNILNTYSDNNCKIDLTYMSKELASWYVNRYNEMGLAVQLIDHVENHLGIIQDLNLKNTIVFHKQIMYEQKMSDEIISLKNIENKIKTIKESNGNKNVTKKVKNMDDLQNNVIYDNAIITDNALMKCEKMIFEYENKRNKIELILKQIKEMKKNEKLVQLNEKTQNIELKILKRYVNVIVSSGINSYDANESISVGIDSNIKSSEKFNYFNQSKLDIDFGIINGVLEDFGVESSMNSQKQQQQEQKQKKNNDLNEVEEYLSNKQSSLITTAHNSTIIINGSMHNISNFDIKTSSIYAQSESSSLQSISWYNSYYLSYLRSSDIKLNLSLYFVVLLYTTGVVFSCLFLNKSDLIVMNVQGLITISYVNKITKMFLVFVRMINYLIIMDNNTLYKDNG